MALNKKALALCCAIPFGIVGATWRDDASPSLEQRAEGCSIKSSSKWAVVLVDMQKYFIDMASADEMGKELPNYFDVLDYSKKNGIPVVVLEYRFPTYQKTMPALRDKVDSLSQKLYVNKHHNDGFIDTDLKEQLRCGGVENILLMGLYACCCVKDTAEGGIKAGFKVYTSRDIISNRRGLKQDEPVRWFKENAVFTDSYKDILKIISYELSDKSKHNQP